MNVFCIPICLALSFFALSSIDCDAKITSCLCKPYFASIKVSSANLRLGPGREYKVKIKYTMKGSPVLINAKYDHWRRIVDPDGTEGWLHKNQLSTKRHVMTIKNDVFLMSGTKEKAKVLAKISKNVTMDLKEIRGNWCKVSCKYNNKKFSGWVKKSDIFGTFNDELGKCK